MWGKVFLGCLTEATSDGCSLRAGHPMESGFQVCCLIGHLAFQMKHCVGSSPRWMRITCTPPPHHDTLLSSMTVFRDSIHIGSISPSSKIHLGPSWEMLASSLMMEEKSPVRNHRWLLFSSTGPGSLDTASWHWLQHSWVATRQGRPSFASCSTWNLTLASGAHSFWGPD